jgi:hypothetical protein
VFYETSVMPECLEIFGVFIAEKSAFYGFIFNPAAIDMKEV